MTNLILDSDVPLYRQISEQIRSKIKEGEFPELSRIPSEAQLCEQYNVSRITVRQALQELVRAGFLNRVQGKGTFVAKRRYVQQLQRLTSISESLIDRGFAPGTKTIEIRRETPQDRIALRLNVSEDEEILLVVRLRLSDDIPLVLNYSYFPHTLCNDLIDAIATGPSIYKALKEHLGIEVSEIQQTIELTYATEFEAKHLNIQPGSPVFLVRATTYDISNRPVEYVKSIFRSDRTEFFAKLVRN